MPQFGKGNAAAKKGGRPSLDRRQRLERELRKKKEAPCPLRLFLSHKTSYRIIKRPSVCKMLQITAARG